MLHMVEVNQCTILVLIGESPLGWNAFSIAKFCLVRDLAKNCDYLLRKGFLHLQVIAQGNKSAYKSRESADKRMGMKKQI